MVRCGAGGWQGYLHSAEGKRLSRKQLTPGASWLADLGPYEHPDLVTCARMSLLQLLEQDQAFTNGVFSNSVYIFLLCPSTQSQTGVDGSVYFSVFSWGEYS